MITTDEHIDVGLIPSDYSISFPFDVILYITCLLYTSDAADE